MPDYPPHLNPCQNIIADSDLFGGATAGAEANPAYCSTQMIFIVLPQPDGPTDSRLLLVESCNPLDVLAPETEKFVQSLVLLVQLFSRPVTVELVSTTVV